ncbi:MAG: hypothetical protein ACK4QW_06505 [Alphaproteobacteria bacterium]
MSDLSRLPNASLPSKSSVAIYRSPGGGGLFWAVATAQDKSLDFVGQTPAQVRSAWIVCHRSISSRSVADRYGWACLNSQ